MFCFVPHPKCTLQMGPETVQSLNAFLLCQWCIAYTINLLDSEYCLTSRQTISKPLKYTKNGIKRAIHTRCTTGWYQLVSCGRDVDFIVSINIRKSDFLNELLPQFENMRARMLAKSPYSKAAKQKGRIGCMRPVDVLGLALWYLKTSNRMFKLCPTFGLVPTSVGDWLEYGMSVFYALFSSEAVPNATIIWPSVTEMERSSQALAKAKPNIAMYLKGVFGVADGGRFRCANYDDANLQNVYFEGYTQSTEVTNLFVWNFFGEIIHAAVNYLGSWHDSKLAGISGLYWLRLSDEETPPGYAILGDSAFTTHPNVTNAKILRFRKLNEAGQAYKSLEMAAVDCVLQSLYPAYRQSGEWGVNSLKGPFRRLTTVLPADSCKRYRIIALCCYLMNYRTRTIGHNQIKSVFS